MASGSEDYWATSGRLLAALIEAIKVSVVTGGDLINAISDVEGSTDGIITLAQLNSAQCEMLGKLTGIDTSLLTGGNLLDALDALDGTMDGRLTLAELNTSSVKTNLDTSITKLTDVITALGNQLTKLGTIENYTHPKTTFIEEVWTIDPQQTIQFAGVWAGRLNMRMKAALANTQDIYIRYIIPVTSSDYDFKLEAGDIIDDNATGTYFARVYAGTVVLTTQDSG